MPIDTGLLNANLNRAYPFVANYQVVIPDYLVVDFRAEILDGDWDPEVHRVYLAWMTRYEDTLRFGFRSDAPSLEDEELVFVLNLNDPRYRTVFADSTPLLDRVEERCGCTSAQLCNSDFDQETGCTSQICNPDFDFYCGPDHICNPNFLPQV